MVKTKLVKVSRTPVSLGVSNYVSGARCQGELLVDEDAKFINGERNDSLQ